MVRVVVVVIIVGVVDVIVVVARSEKDKWLELLLL